MMGFFQNFVTWYPCIFQGIVNKWYARIWLDSPCRCPKRFKKLIFATRGNNIFFSNYISITWNNLTFLFCYNPPLEEVVTLHFIIFESPLLKDTLCQVWLKLAKWFSRRRFLKVVYVLSLCGYYLPLEKCIALKLNKFEFPLTKNTLCHAWLKLARRFWRRFSKVVYIFSICCYYLPLEKGQGPPFEINLIPLTQGCSVPSLVEIGPVVLEMKSPDSMYFYFVAIIPLWQRAWSFIWTNFNHLYLGMRYVKYGKTWLGDFEEVNVWKDMDGHLDRQIDRYTIKKRCFAKHNWALSSEELAHVN